MAWAEGETLGQFVESNYKNAARLTNLIDALSQLSSYLESQGIAHGDLQEGNLMVADEGRKIQLIDYDGMFVPEVGALGGSELGHRDYQHPKRAAAHFGPRIDRFSFIVVNLCLRALCVKPTLWNQSQSGAGVIVCRANDFAAAHQSKILQEIAQIPTLAQHAKNFAAICAADFSATPTLADFVAGRNIPLTAATFTATPSTVQLGYISQYPVLDAANYAVFFKHIGSMVELVGKIVEVSEKHTRHGRPYVFINFAPWKGKAVKIALWSTALSGQQNTPTAAWAGRWVTIRGLVEPVYANSRYGYEHITITATAVNQISSLTEQEARYRLRPSSAPNTASSASNTTPVRSQPTTNAAALAALKSTQAIKPATQPAAVVPPVPKPAVSPNQAALQKMRQQSAASTSSQSQMRSTGSLGSSPGQKATTAAQPRQTPTKKSGLFAWLVDLFS